MLYAMVNGVKRQPERREDKAICNLCGAQLIPVLPTERIPHWRHPAGDCDKWSEPEGEWHLGWKEKFSQEYREIPLRDEVTQEAHRADIHCTMLKGKPTTLELQHSHISEEERNQRDSFYARYGRMFWLLHLHDEKCFNKTYFRLSLGLSRSKEKIGNKNFFIASWVGRSKQFVEKWKRSKSHVFMDYDGTIFYFATVKSCKSLVAKMGRGEFAVCELTASDFINAVLGI